MIKAVGEHRILQIHPARRCNLRCLHCYSLSGPEESEEIDLALLTAALSEARAEGYTILAVSGGEPLLYRSLVPLVRHARQLGMGVTLTTNGMLMDSARLQPLIGYVDLIAVSLDGLPAAHNHMRASNRAFETMASCLENLRSAGIPFGFIFTLTQYNLNELDWVANFAREQGAGLLQIHPLEMTGRAQEQLEEANPDQIEALFACAEVVRLQEAFGGSMKIHLDFLTRSVLEAERDSGDASSDTEYVLSSLSDLISPLVIETSGIVVPIQYGFARQFALGNLRDASLSRLAARWKTKRAAAFAHLNQQACKEVLASEQDIVFNWYERLALHAARASETV